MHARSGTPDDLPFLEAIEVGRLIRKRHLSSVEATTAQLERIARLDHGLRSYATVVSDHALAAAATADAEIARGDHRGPLHGVPIAVKDLCDTAGIPTAAGMPMHRNRIPTADATVVARLKAAGAVILGKLQMTEGAFSAHHPDIPPPINPWNPALWPGVSSSGSGVATAAGLCYASLGSDTLGSIRFPSTMNGVTGLKPTRGRVSRAGVVPLAESLDHVGPMTRSVADAAAMLAAIAGPDARDPTTLQQPPDGYLATIEGGVRDIRIGIDRAMIAASADADAMRVVEDAAATLAGLGARIRAVQFPATDQVVQGALRLCAFEAAQAHAATFPERAAAYGPVLTSLLQLGRSVEAGEIAGIRQRRAAFSAEVEALFADVDLLLMPAMSHSGLTVEWMVAHATDMDARMARIRFTVPFDMTGSPTLTLPGGVAAANAPVGFQLIGRQLDEALVLRAGHAFQRATDWHLRRPPLA